MLEDFGSSLVHCAMNKSQSSANGFYVTGDIYFNRGSVVLPDGSEIFYYLRECEIELSCARHYIVPDSLAFILDQSEARNYKLEVNNKKETSATKSADMNVDLSVAFDGAGSVTPKAGASGKMAVGDSSTVKNVSTISLDEERRTKRMTALVSRSDHSAVWKILPDPFGDEGDIGAPKGSIIGRRMRSPDGSIAYIKVSSNDEVAGTVTMMARFFPSQVIFSPIVNAERNESRITRIVQSIRSVNKMALVMRIRLAKEIKNSIKIGEF